MEKKKFEKIKETLTKTEEEFKDLKKVCSLNFFYLQINCSSQTIIYVLFMALVGESDNLPPLVLVRT